MPRPATAAGKFNRRVALWKPIYSRNPAGETTQSWQQVAAVWASIESTGKAEATIAGQVTQAVTHTVRIRYRPDIDETWRVVRGGKILSIASIVNVDLQNAVLELVCGESKP